MTQPQLDDWTSRRATVRAVDRQGRVIAEGRVSGVEVEHVVRIQTSEGADVLWPVSMCTELGATPPLGPTISEAIARQQGAA